MVALWGLLWCASHQDIEKIWIFGDSKVLIDHMNEKAWINTTLLGQWMERINCLKNQFISVTFFHVYREMNVVVDHLSKKGLECRSGVMQYHLFRVDGSGATGTVNLP